MIIKEWKCLDCETYFESSDDDPQCPQCSKIEPERVFLTPPAVRDAKTTSTDRELKRLAQDFGLSDMNNKHGEAVKKGGTGQFTNDSRVMQAVAGLPPGAQDQFSPLQSKFSNPRTWTRVQDRKA